MAEMYAVKKSDLTAIADAIRLKRDIVSDIEVEDMATQIGLIDGGDIDWTEIGYTGTPQYVIDGFNYAKTIKDNWNPSRTSLMKAFYENQNIVFMPLIDTSNITNMWYAFYRCYYLQIIPSLDTSKVTNFQEVFVNCSNLLEIAPLNLSSATTIQGAFDGCSKIKSLDLILSDKLTNIAFAFRGCTFLDTLTFRSFDMSNITSLQQTFMNCGSLETIPHMNTSSKLTSLSQAFQSSKIISITSNELSDTSHVTGMMQAFYVCTNLKTVELNCSKVIDIRGAFGTCNSIESIILTNLGAGYLTTQTANYSYYTLNLASTNKLTESAVIALFNSIADIASLGIATQKIILSSTVYNLLSASTIVIATNKGWTVGTS